MIDDLIIRYSNYFKKLNRGFNKGLGKAPHKPVLLLSLIELIGKGIIDTNRVYISSDLLLTYRKNWKKLVSTAHSSNFSLPFFHLRSEPFWYLVPKTGKEISVTSSKSIKSFRNLVDSLAFAEIDRDLFLLLQDRSNQVWFEELLLNTYFPDEKSNFLHDNINYEEKSIENEILHEPKEVYLKHMKRLRETLEDDAFEEEVFVRGGLFKKTIPKIYNHTCCITGLKIESTKNVQMIDACHIYPFSISNDDTVTNGIALSPTLHRAFDRGLLTINTDFIVRISPTIIENDTAFSITQFEGRKIILPEKEKWYPAQESLSWHNKEVFLL